MKRYRPKMFTEDPVTKEIKAFEDYRIKHPELGEDHIRVTMAEDPEGLWMKGEDVKAEIRRITDIYETRIKELKVFNKWYPNQSGKWSVCTCDNVPCTCSGSLAKCNCEDYANDPCRLLWLSSWICPVHGFQFEGKEKMTDYFCLDCNKLLEQVTPGVIAEAWLRTDGNKDIMKAVPGGIQYGKELGFICNECHDKEENDGYNKNIEKGNQSDEKKSQGG